MLVERRDSEHVDVSIWQYSGRQRLLSSAGDIRAARSLLGRTARELAEKSGISLATKQKLEPQTGIPTCHVPPRTLKDLRRAFEEVGIEFIRNAR